MKAVDFDYARPTGLDQALALLADGRREARVIAGGQTLVPLLAMRLVRPELLLDISAIDELHGIALDGDWLRIGAATRQRQAERSELVRQHLPLLAAALPWVGHIQTRNRGTVGGSLANADPSAEIPLVAVTLGAELRLRSPAGERRLGAAEFLQGPMQNALATNELLLEIAFPVSPGGRTGAGFIEVNARASDFAILAAAAEVTLDGNGCCARASCGLGGASPVPFRAEATEAALIGGGLSDDAIAAACRLAEDGLDPTGDLQASAAYRRRVAPDLLARAIGAARDAAQSEA